MTRNPNNRKDLELHPKPSILGFSGFAFRIADVAGGGGGGRRVAGLIDDP